MSQFFRIFQHLLPKSRAWRIVVEKQLREFFEGLGPFQADYKLFIDQIFEDIDPALTRELLKWEDQFQLSGTGNETERRSALDAAWKAQGGQSPGYLQGILRDAGFDVFVHEWWFFVGPVRMTRDPRDFLKGIVPAPAAIFGEPEAVFGEPPAVFGATIVDGFVLVNKGPGVTYAIPSPASAFGEPSAVFGEPEAIFGETNGFRFIPESFPIPDDPDKWPFFVYVGGATFPEKADVPIERQIEFERMILKYFPGQLWIGMLINYV
jgi:hypothetical protein